MEIRTSDEAKESILDFTKRYANLLKDKRQIDADIKALKEEYKEDGVPVQVVTKMFNKLKADKKKTDSQRFEEETIEEWLSEDKDIDDSIGELSSPL